MAEVVILGAGPTGLSAAYHLEQNGFSNYKLFEKEQNTGGLCRSVTQDGFTFDYTGHLLHTSDLYFKNFIESLGLDNFNVINRKSFVYSQNIYTRYPYQINLYGLPAQTIVDCIEGFVKRNCKSKGARPAKPKFFYDWVLQNFGTGFGKHFFFPYQSKIFSYDIKKLSASWTGRFVPNTSLQELISGAIKDRPDDMIGYNAQFFYPKTGGIQFWVDKLAKKINNKICTNFSVESVDVVNKIVKFSNGHQEPFKFLITTIPLDYLLNNIKEPANSTLYKASPNLVCNSVINFNLGINRPNLTDKHWVYFPEKKYPHYRLGFPHNFSNKMAPDGCSSIYGEFSYINKSSNSIDTLLKKAIKSTQELFHINNSEIVTKKIIKIQHAYVIYNNWRDNNVLKILKQLEQNQIYSVGRYGQWKYSSMQEAVLDGKQIAESLIKII